MAKVDIEAAYRLVLVHPQNCTLLGMKWYDSIYIDGMLPFGLRSAPKIFNSVADALEWCCHRRGVAEIDHYLDDFVTLGPPGSTRCQENLDCIQTTCSHLNVPLAEHKVEGPATSLVFLGIEIDTMAGILRLPDGKLQRILAELERWSGRKSCRRRKLESLVGLLQHACRVVRPGRSFLRRMIDLLSVAQQHYHHIRLNNQFMADLLWWRTFLRRWNGVYGFPPPDVGLIELASDASGSWGCGAVCGRDWWQFQWPAVNLRHHISFLELFAILVACITWGPGWHGRRVQCWCDNQAAIQVVKARTCKDKGMMYLLRCMFFIEAKN